MSTTALPAGNPFAAPWDATFGIPPFAAIQSDHFRPAFDVAMAEQRREVEAVASSTEPPSFANTIEALERSGTGLKRVGGVFWNLAGADTNEAIQAVEREVAPLLAQHRSAIFLDDRLFARVAELHERRDDLGLDAERRRVLERYHTIFVRAGAKLPPDAKARIAQITERLASLATRFSQNVLADEKAFVLPLAGESDLAGLSEAQRAAALRAAGERGLEGHVVTLARSSVEGFLTFADRRDLRERAYAAWTARGDGGGETDNRAIIAETVRLRDERARLLGYKSYAAFKLEDTMAGTPDRVMALLDEVWAPARARAAEEEADLQGLVAEEGRNFVLAGHDWRYFAERLRRQRHSLDDAEIRPYFALEGMIEAAFDVAGRLFDLRFAERTDFSLYHPDVRAWEVTDGSGRHVGVFLGDYFARPSKRSGAWMSAFRSQERLSGEVRPIIVNVMNFSKGEPALLSFDDARTLFHEFGHALHGLLSDVTYPLLAGTAVPGDFVELPSQLYEHWLSRPEVLRRFARHHATGEPIPEALLQRILAARNFQQGFATVEYLGSAYVDMAFHTAPEPERIDARGVETATAERIGMPTAIAMRHRPPHFTHVFSGEGYAAGYYSYLWSEVLDADAFDAFEEAGDIFDLATAERLKRFVYAAGNLRDAAEAYTLFRGRLPTPEALLRKRDLASPAIDAA